MIVVIAEGFLLRDVDLIALCPQLLVAATLKVPFMKPLPILKVIELVPWPAVIVVLAGAVQLYPDAPITPVIL